MAGLQVERQCYLHTVAWRVITTATRNGNYELLEKLQLFIELPFIWLNNLLFLSAVKLFLIKNISPTPPGASVPPSRQVFTVYKLFSTADPLHLLTPWCRVLLQKLTGFAASQEIPRIYGTRKFITVLTSARHLSLS
jgi:hypothetical protein